MTDAEMVKAMEICKDKEIPCDDCPLVECGDCEEISRQYFYDRFKQLQSENTELKSSLTHANEELKTRIRRAEKAVYVAARNEIEAIYNVETMDKREYAEQIEAYMFDLFCRADRELAEEGKDD